YRSATIGVAPRAATACACSSSRTSATTSCPCSCNSPSKCDPMNPVGPVSAIFMAGGSPVALCASADRDGLSVGFGLDGTRALLAEARSGRVAVFEERVGPVRCPGPRHDLVEFGVVRVERHVGRVGGNDLIDDVWIQQVLQPLADDFHRG